MITVSAITSSPERPSEAHRRGPVPGARRLDLDAALIAHEHSIVHSRVVRAVIVALVLFAAGCDFPNMIPPGSGSVRYRDQIADAVTVAKNVTYGGAVNLSGHAVDLRLDMYEPTGDTVRSRPAIVWVHGGSFCCGTKASPEIVDEATVFAKKGYLTVSIDYRLESPGCAGSRSNCIEAIREATADGQTAVRFLRTNAARYRIDPNRIAIGGSSAGAITALNVGYSSSEDLSARVRAAVSLSGAQLVAGAVSQGDAPAIDFHCTTDPLVSYQWAVSTINDARAHGLDAFLESWNATCHVPYADHRQQILDQTRNFLWWEMDLAHAAT
jgi:poly(3-hydroxybutyrate) depolymerase